MLIEPLVVVAAASMATALFARSVQPSDGARRIPSASRPDVTPAAPAEAPVVAVRMLGPVEVQRDGVSLPLRGRPLELVAYLASHPRGVTEDQIRTGLWWDHPVSRASFNNLMSDTRRQLGLIEGQPALPVRGGDGRYRLHPAVTCDLHQLEYIRDMETATAMLGSVRGRPFEAARTYAWADREGLAGWAANRIADAAHRVASSQLNTGHPLQALATAERGLLGAPGEESLFRDRILAHAASGNLSAARRVIAELLAGLDGDDPADVLHPDTIDLIDRYQRPFPNPYSLGIK